MADVLEFTIDKFTFKFPTDRTYHREGVWALPEDGGRVRIGLSDYLQQSSGDVAFAEVEPEGTNVAVGDTLAEIETLKADVVIPAPVTGTVVEVNPVMETAPEAINQDPYGAGWLAVVQVKDWEADRARLLDPRAYFDLVRTLAEQETKQA
jgi:glycine cleavage system H protein